ncbi:glycine zipper family protein [Roseovarius sp. EL26]|uniref:glycine zipper family protein n=1 Tax=Roseovarius sp. EL26 TaxID=2126672 RepID=UPI0013C40B49|nr:glycine zipper family protein [Roseovarius sp. EL26]
MKPLIVIGFTVLSVTACTQEPVSRDLVVDGIQTAQFDADRQECIELARNYEDESVKRGALRTAAVGGLVGAVEGGVGGAVVGAAVGGGLGAWDAAPERDDDRREVLIRCMQGRGHAVIG